jgi:transposase-like protein
MLCVRWYLRYSLSYRDLEEIMAERGLSVDHVRQEAARDQRRWTSSARVGDFRSEAIR